MGREIRRVPPNWEHPVYVPGDCRPGEFKPMLKATFEKAHGEWASEKERWDSGENEQRKRYTTASFEEYYGEEPDNDCQYVCYTPFAENAFSWFQVFETVSEGTPVTPPFQTEEEITDWLVEKGECHGTEYECRFSREQAIAFVKSQWAPSFMMSSSDNETVIASGIAAVKALED